MHGPVRCTISWASCVLLPALPARIECAKEGMLPHTHYVRTLGPDAGVSRSLQSPPDPQVPGHWLQVMNLAVRGHRRNICSH